MNKMNLIGLLIVSLLIACDEKRPAHLKPIILGDTSMIVSEYDSTYLQNQTVDISPAKTKSSERQITEMMVQVDSLKTSKKLQNETVTPERIQGFTINFSECKVVFNGMLAHALQTT